MGEMKNGHPFYLILRPGVPEAPEDGTLITVSQAELSTTVPYRYVAASEETEKKK